MADGRKKLSGSEYQKRALDKSKKEQEVLSKTPKLDDFFTKKVCVTQKSETNNRDCTNLDYEGLYHIFSSIHIFPSIIMIHLSMCIKCIFIIYCHN